MYASNTKYLKKYIPIDTTGEQPKPYLRIYQAQKVEILQEYWDKSEA